VEKNSSVDELLQVRFTEETNFWTKVLNRLLDITITLAENNLAFRGHYEEVGKPQSGKFLALVDIFSRYDPFWMNYCKSRRVQLNILALPFKMN
jgi:hypothetical protein